MFTMFGSRWLRGCRLEQDESWSRAFIPASLHGSVEPSNQRTLLWSWASYGVAGDRNVIGTHSEPDMEVIVKSRMAVCQKNGTASEHKAQRAIKVHHIAQRR